ncbi:MAG: hypothetical protein JNK05_20220 [Myxococcales bacterium]|nr:hypothetical protein [Myxococcales bacterium]
MTESERRQRVLARFIADPVFEARVRADPSAIAQEESLSLEYVCRLAATSARRVEAFRRSQAHKDAARAGAPPKQSGW